MSKTKVRQNTKKEKNMKINEMGAVFWMINLRDFLLAKNSFGYLILCLFKENHSQVVDNSFIV